MTQTSPKPADQTSTNGHNPKSPAHGYVGSHTTPSPKPQLKPKSVPVWQKLLQGWGNLSLRYKLALLLMSGAAVPVIAVTQGLVSTKLPLLVPRLVH